MQNKCWIKLNEMANAMNLSQTSNNLIIKTVNKKKGKKILKSELIHVELRLNLIKM